MGDLSDLYFLGGLQKGDQDLGLGLSEGWDYFTS